ncbi:MAG: hypothetical protein J7527_13930, partial [Chitinophagaceae bacterium]|nr:hypothetical protein [Chitinophagaceae bacterium]
MKNVFLFITTLLSCQILFAQDTSVLKRAPYRLVLAVDKETTFEEQINETPYLYPNRSMQMYPGETVFLEVELSGTDIVSMKAVKEITKISSTLTLKFVQNAENGIHKSMMLTVQNPFPLQLEYQAMIFPFKAKKFVNTDVYP